MATTDLRKTLMVEPGRRVRLSDLDPGREVRIRQGLGGRPDGEDSWNGWRICRIGCGRRRSDPS